MDASAFWLDALSNLIATIAGVAIGLPIALWLDRRARSMSEKEKRTERQERCRTVIRLLNVELYKNARSLRQFHKDLDNYPCFIQLESWRAFADGGELQWIDDPMLLHYLSLAYANLRQFAAVYSKYEQTFFFPKPPRHEIEREQVFRSALGARGRALRASEAALKRLDDSLRRDLLHSRPPG